MGTNKRVKRILVDIGVLDHAEHSRQRVYPQEANVELRLTAPAAVNTFSAWTALIPVGVVHIPYHITGLVPENVEAADTFFIELATSATPTSDEYIGQLRLRMGDPAIYLATMAPLLVKMGEIEKDYGVWGRIKAASAGGFWIDFSFILTVWLQVSTHITLEEFPW